MCFDERFSILFIDKQIADLLSQKTSGTCPVTLNNSNSFKTLFNQMVSRTHSFSAMYSDSADDRATQFCLDDLQLIGTSPRVTTRPLQDFRSSTSPAQSASE